MHECRIEIAGVPVLIHCQHQENVEFFQDYWTQKPERLLIEPGPADLERMQAGLDRMDEAEGFPTYRRSDAFLENNAIHSLLARNLIWENVLLMHGSALCMDGWAYIFTARSGTGKSTHARLWREAFGDRVWMINDDKPLLRITETGVLVCGTPWDGKHHLSRNASAPLKAIVKLERDAFNHIEPMEKTDALPMLMAQTFASNDLPVMVRMVELEKRLIDLVDFYTLGCNMDPEAAKVAWEGMDTEGL